MGSVKKFSRKREAILNTIRNTKSHPSADWVYEQLKSEFPDISLGTVYRNIAGFKAEGLVTAVGVVGGEERYDGTTAPHAHFVCQSCGQVLDVEGELDPALDEAVGKEIGADVTHHQLIFYGKCKHCR